MKVVISGDSIELPDVLRPLVLFNAAELRHSSFDRDSEALIEQFDGLLFWLRRRRWLIVSVGGFALSIRYSTLTSLAPSPNCLN
jgi:hypothetical protein